MSERKIALIIAGGVSLGSYEAGVLTEFLYALEHHNQEDGEQRFVLDVITGSSAGGLTAALVARIMMYDLPGRRRHLFKAWVEDSDIRHLLIEPPENALLSKKLIFDVADRYVTGGSFTSDHPASFAPDKLRMTFSLSNMSGVDYAIPYFPPRQDERFGSTFFSDLGRFTIDRSALPDRQEWQSIARHAIACGNFPAAFRPQALEREQADYPGAEEIPFLPGELAFVDGGLFNNEPLREAIHLAREADDGEIDPKRIFLLVDPSSNRSLQAEVDPLASLWNHSLRLATMVVGESQARDWLRAERVNNELDWRDKLVKVLAQLLASVEVSDGTAALAELSDLAEAIVNLKRERFPDRYEPEYLEHSLQRIRQRHRGHFDALALDGGAGTIRQKLFERFLFVLNSAAGLQNKAIIQPVLISSDAKETAGDQLAAFGGFFKQEWREHDYRLGRIAAHQVLNGVLGRYPEEAGSPEYEIPEEWKNFPSETLNDADRGLRREVRKRSIGQIMRILGDNVPWVLRLPLRRFVLRPIIGKVLEL